MKTKLVTVLILASFGIESCSSSYVLSKVPQQTPPFTTQYKSYDELMEMADGKIVTIIMTDGHQERGTLLYATPDSVAWGDFRGGFVRGARTSQVDHLEYSTSFPWEGGAIGLLLLTVPFLVEGGWEPGHPSRLDEPDYTGRAIIVIGGLFGGAAGVGIGSQVHAKHEFHVAPPGGEGITKPDTSIRH